MKIAIVGSREGFTKEFIFQKLWIFCANLTINGTIITGGAKGVDTYAELFAKEFGCNLEVINPINPKDKLSYLFRNIEIITKSDAIIAFWNGESKGTKFVIDYAQARGKIIEVVRI